MIWGGRQWEDFRKFLLKQLHDLMEAFMKPAVLAEIMQEQQECDWLTQARLENMAAAADRQVPGK